MLNTSVEEVRLKRGPDSKGVVVSHEAQDFFNVLTGGRVSTENLKDFREHLKDVVMFLEEGIEEVKSQIAGVDKMIKTS